MSDSIETQAQEWFTCDLPRKERKKFMRRDNYHAALFVGSWFLGLFAIGYLCYVLYPSLWAIPAFLLYGVLYSASDSRWHECSHGTAFKTAWVNEVVHFIAAAMQFKDVVFNRWSHSNHHTWTVITEKDLEVPVRRPVKFYKVIINFIGLEKGYGSIKVLVLHSLGIVTDKAKMVVPEEDHKRMFFWARMALLTHIAAIGLAIGFQSWLPVLFWGLPRFYGNFVLWPFVLAQHAGLAENVWDHRLSTRTVIVNPVLSYLYMDMQYHLEHHLYPTVPFHRLRDMHERVKDQLPPAYKGMWDVFREMMPALIRQRKDADYCIKRPLPEKEKAVA